MRTVTISPSRAAEISDTRDLARATWNAARERYAATREAIANGLDTQAVALPAGHLESAQLGDGENEASTDPYARMTRRSLMLTDALHRHAFARIAETVAVLDDIDRAVAAGRADTNQND